MKAKFIGTHGSMGLIEDRTYEIHTQFVNDFLGITVKIGDEYMFCPYSSLDAFLINWKIL